MIELLLIGQLTWEWYEDEPDPSGQLLRILGGGDEAFIVVQQLRHIADPGGHNGHSGAVRLQDHQRLGLPDAG